MIALLMTAVVFAHDPLIADQTVIDRGIVRIGPTLTQTIRLSNHSQNPVTITGVTSACGCLAPKLDRTELGPYENATLTVEVNTLSQPAGHVSWSTHVGWRTANESGHLTLTLKANLIAEIRVEPAAVAFQVRRTRSIDLTVTDTRSKPFRITAVGSSMPQVTAEIAPSADKTVQRIRLTANADGPPGMQSAVVWFTTDDPMYPQIRVPVNLNNPAKTRVAASPSALLLDGPSGRVLLRDSDGQPIQIERIETQGPFTATANGAVITVSSVATKASAATRGKVTVYLAKPMTESISIPVDIR